MMSEPQQEAAEQKPTTEIAKRQIEMTQSGWELKTLDDAWRFATAVIDSGMAPKGYTTKAAVLIAMQHGAEIGLKPMQALHSIAVINGRATVWGDAIPALLDASGLCEDRDEYLEGDGDKMTAVCRLKRVGRETPILRTFSVADAKAAGLWNKAGPWTQYPKRMLAMRARSWAARDGFADVLRGLHVREEVQDYEPTRTPQARPTAVLTADGRIESSEPAAPQEAAGDVVDAVAEPLVNAAGELF